LFLLLLHGLGQPEHPSWACMAHGVPGVPVSQHIVYTYAVTVRSAVFNLIPPCAFGCGLGSGPDLQIRVL
jgi:hypothetical protein